MKETILNELKIRKIITEDYLRTEEMFFHSSLLVHLNGKLQEIIELIDFVEGL